jgi:hypothetical protein
MRSSVLSNREIIQAAFVAIGTAATVADKVYAVASAIENMGHADRVTTRQILRQLRMTGRA